MLTRSLLALLLAASLTVVLPATAAAATEARSSSSAESMLVDLLNDRRAEAGRAPLTARADLHDVARNWSFAQAERGRMGHNPDLADQACCWTRIAENVARAGGMDGASAAAVARRLMDLWRGSSSHDQAMVDQGVDQVGVGVVVDDDGNAWGTMVFRMCDGTTCAGGAQGPADDRTISWAPEPPPEPDPVPEPDPAPAAVPESDPAPEAAEGAAPAPHPAPEPTTQTTPVTTVPAPGPPPRPSPSPAAPVTPVPTAPSEIDRTVGTTSAAPLRPAADVGEPTPRRPDRRPLFLLLAGTLCLGAATLVARR